MQVYLAVTPAELQAAAPYCRAFAHVAYSLGPESTLLRQSVLLQARGGLLSVTDRDAPAIAEPEKLCAAVLRECGRRSYTGVLLDFEEGPRRDRLEFAAQLGRALSAGRRTLYVPEGYAQAAPGAAVLICTALSGGNYRERLQEAAQTHGGPGRLALDVQRLRMDFRLPAKTGEGAPLTGPELDRLMAEEAPAVFFSQDLCARYFTYTRAGEAHFVLFDDADTLQQKLRTGAALGVPAAFFMYPEVRDLLPKLFPGKRG